MNQRTPPVPHPNQTVGAAAIEELSLEDLGMTPHTDPRGTTMMSTSMLETLDGASVESERIRLVGQIASLSAKERAELIAAAEKHARSEDKVERNKRREFRRPGDEDPTPVQFATFTQRNISHPTSQAIPATNTAANKPSLVFYQPQGRPFIPDPKYTNVAPPSAPFIPTANKKGGVGKRRSGMKKTI